MAQCLNTYENSRNYRLFGRNTDDLLICTSGHINDKNQGYRIPVFGHVQHLYLGGVVLADLWRLS